MVKGFTNTTYVDTINSLVDGFKKKLDNPYYIHNNNSPVISNWFNQDTKASTLDEAIKTPYTDIGKISPMKYNYIEDAIWYGSVKIPGNADYGDFGLESEVGGTGVILPNTWIPIENDYFTIKHLDNVFLFKVTNVTINTIESDANLYEFTYTLEKTQKDSLEKINKQILRRYKMIVNNIGTQYNSIILENDYNFAKEINNTIDILQKFYKSLYYRNRVQAFVFSQFEEFFYDPYLVEFICRNDILENDEYMYIGHMTKLRETFAIDYERSFYRGLELHNIDRFHAESAIGGLITDPNSLFTTRLEPYYELRYKVEGYAIPIEIISADLYNAVRNKEYYGELDPNQGIYNIIIDFFNDVEIDAKYLIMINKLNFNNSKKFYYLIPIIIFILQNRVKHLFS